MSKTHNPARSQQQGLVLFISLIVLVIMTLAAIAMVRSITASTQVANNLALRQGTTAAADVALESARQWLINTSNLSPATLNADSAANGYSATNTVSPISPNDATQWRANSNWVWVANSCTPKPCTPAAMVQATTAATVANTSGFSAAYLIQRSCSNGAAPSMVIDIAAASGNPCNLVQDIATKSKKGSTFRVNYLITVRIQGPKNTVSFYQTSLY
ncbi:MAG: pilus assembly PilX family protein [Iodobacter sp.]